MIGSTPLNVGDFLSTVGGLFNNCDSHGQNNVSTFVNM